MALAAADSSRTFTRRSRGISSDDAGRAFAVGTDGDIVIDRHRLVLLFAPADPQDFLYAGQA